MTSSLDQVTTYVPPPREEWELVIRATMERLVQMQAPWLMEPYFSFGRLQFGIVGLCVFCLRPIVCSKPACGLGRGEVITVLLEDERMLTVFEHDAALSATHVPFRGDTAQEAATWRTTLESHALQCALQWWSRR